MSKGSVIADLIFKDLNGQDLPGTEKSIQAERDALSQSSVGKVPNPDVVVLVLHREGDSVIDWDLVPF